MLPLKVFRRDQAGRKSVARTKVIAGYLIVNDVSVRDWQRRAQTMTLGKSFDTHGPIGPWIVTPDEIGESRSRKSASSRIG